MPLYRYISPRIIQPFQKPTVITVGGKSVFNPREALLRERGFYDGVYPLAPLPPLPPLKDCQIAIPHYRVENGQIVTTYDIQPLYP